MANNHLRNHTTIILAHIANLLVEQEAGLIHEDIPLGRILEEVSDLAESIDAYVEIVEAGYLDDVTASGARNVIMMHGIRRGRNPVMGG